MQPTFRVSNLHSDLSDSVALAILEHQIAPPDCPTDLRVLRSADLQRRAAYVLETAKRMGMEAVQIQPDDITAARPRLMLAFVAALHGLFDTLDASRGSTHQQHRHVRAPAEREANTYRMWLVSLGVEVGDLIEECKSGLPLLRVEAFLKPACVQWNQVRERSHSISMMRCLHKSHVAPLVSISYM